MDDTFDMFKRLLCCFTVLPAALAAQAAPSTDFVMIAPLNQAMPLAQFDKGKISGGILRDMGLAISRRLGRTAQFLTVPVDGTAAALTEGRADGLCFVLPHWIDGDFNWSVPFMDDAEMVVSRKDAPPVRSLAALRDLPVGSVKAYRYPRVEQVLGGQFVRRDFQTTEENIRKLAAGKVEHALLSKSAVEYYNYVNKTEPLRPDLTIAAFEAQCAFSKKSQVAFADIDRVFNMMLKDGTIERIIARYR